MADSKVIIEIISTAKGLKVVAKDTEKLAQATTKVDKAQQAADKSGKKYHKTEKGIHQSNLSSAKGFSKMQQSIGGGSSGLVGAYATLAANVFAATAAFNALRSAAQVETLVEGFTFLADTAGRTSTIISSNIQAITNNALSMEEAMRTSAIAITSGFSTEQLGRLVEVGKNASIALGRNLGDSIDRLIRGVAKLEPEILDELGILVRVDTASRKYAATLGKVAGDLTDFEKRQAFLNATIEQGEEKYSALAESVDVNSFDKLAGTFANLTHNVMNFVNTAIKPLLAIFAGSQVAMFGAIAFLAKGVVSTMFPVLTDLGQRYTDTALKAHAAADAMKTSTQKAFEGGVSDIAKTDVKKGDPAGMKSLIDGAKKGKVSLADLNKAQKSLRISEKLRAKNLDNYSGADKKQKTAELKRIRDLKNAVQDLINKEKQRSQGGLGAIRSAGRANEQDIIASGASGIQGASGMEGFGIAKSSFTELKTEIGKTSAEVTKSFGKDGQSTMSKFGQSTRNGFKLASGGVRLFGAAAINAIPLIGQIIFVVGILITTFKKFFGASKEMSAALSEINTVVSEIPKKMETLAKTTEVLDHKIAELSIQLQIATNKSHKLDLAYDMQRQAALKLANEIKVLGGITTEFADSASKLGKEMTTEAPTKFNMMMHKLKISFRESTGETLNFKNALKEWADKAEHVPSVTGLLIRTFRNLAAESEEAFDELEEGQSVLDANSWSVYGENLKAAFNEIKDPKVLAAYQELGGIEGIMKKAAAESTSFAVRQALVSKALKEVAQDANAQTAAIEGIGAAYEEITKKLVAFKDRNKKKNPFIDTADDIDSFSDKLRELVAQTGGDAEKLLKVGLPRELQEAMTQYGISQEDILGTLEQRVMRDGEIVILGKDQFQILGEQFRAHGENLEVIKAEAEARKKVLETLKETHAISIKNAEIDERIAQRLATGKYEITAAGEQRIAKLRFSNAKDFAKDEKASKLLTAKEARDIEITNAKITMAGKSEDEVRLREAKIASIKAVYKSEEERLEAIRLRAIKVAQDVLDTTKAQAGTSGTTIERANSLREGRDGTEGFQQKVLDMQNASQPMLDTLKALGPEGEFAAAAISGTLSIASAIGTIGEKGLASAEGLEAMGSVVGTIGGIMAAASRAQIAEVDKQIAAEKNRDGKSKESLAKIKAMEKKKEEMKRKAFEQNKKMQMAETVINTASAIMAQKGNLPMMLLMGVLGAAQLAVIAKTSYQSTNATVDQPKAQEIQIGKRNNRVDVSQGASPGELAYLRGAKGIGSNANNFIPGGAAGMRRGYNTGGEIRGGEILVGEQGPEVIQARGNYNVIPNERMGGGTTNANFTINAVDAAGVEEVLTAQRGNIISMIREAAHEHGEEFIEAVNPATYKMEE